MTPHHQAGAAQIGQSLQGIAFDQQQVGLQAGRHVSGAILDAADPGATNGLHVAHL